MWSLRSQAESVNLSYLPHWAAGLNVQRELDDLIAGKIKPKNVTRQATVLRGCICLRTRQRSKMPLFGSRVPESPRANLSENMGHTPWRHAAPKQFLCQIFAPAGCYL